MRAKFKSIAAAKIILFLVACFIFTTLSHAVKEIVPKDIIAAAPTSQKFQNYRKQKIAQYKSDPFDNVDVIQAGPLKGYTTDTRQSRQLIALPNHIYTELGYDSKKHILVANFTSFAIQSKNAEHYIAAIPRSLLVSNAYLEKAAFEPRNDPSTLKEEFLAHVQLKFLLSDPIELIAAQSSLTGKVPSRDFKSLKDINALKTVLLKQPIEVDSVSSSFEVVFVREKNITFNDDLYIIRDAFNVAPRIIDYKYRVHEMSEQKNTIDSSTYLTSTELLAPQGWLSKLSKPKTILSTNLFLESVVRSLNFNSHTRRYNLLKYSCTTETFSIIDAVIKEGSDVIKSGEAVVSTKDQLDYYFDNNGERAKVLLATLNAYISYLEELKRKKINEATFINQNEMQLFMSQKLPLKELMKALGVDEKLLKEIRNPKHDFWKKPNKINTKIFTSPAIDGLPGYACDNLLLRNLIK